MKFLSFFLSKSDLYFFTPIPLLVPASLIKPSKVSFLLKLKPDPTGASRSQK